MQPTGLILGIESSCDETAAAVVAEGQRTLSSVVASQFATHAAYGGVVPELASREHLRNIVPVVRRAMEIAGIRFEDLDGIAVTEGPGLAGALLVGVTYAKTLAWALDKPLIGVNHLEGHIHAVLLEHAQARTPHAEAEQPALALVVSGGHTHLYLATQQMGGWSYRTVGRTVDDAAGEAFDKVAKLLGLGYPGGPWIDALAPFGDPHAVPFRFAPVRVRSERQRPAPVGTEDDTLFSFSGIKTAVLRYLETHDMLPAAHRRAAALAALHEPAAEDARRLCDQQTLDLVASFQSAVAGNLVARTVAAAERYDARTMLVSGGVAANSEVRARFERVAEQRGLRVLFPSRALSTDNAAMIAAAAWPRLRRNEHADQELSGSPRLPLG